MTVPVTAELQSLGFRFTSQPAGRVAQIRRCPSIAKDSADAVTDS